MSSPITSIGSSADPESASYQKRAAHYEALLKELRDREAEIRKGGGERRLQREHDRGKLTARERIDALVDDPDAFKEVGVFAGDGMYEEEGGCPAGGTVMGLGHVNGRRAMIVANDATVKAGAWFPITAKKNLRAQEIALENHVPIIYLVDSAGVFLPKQDEIFPDKDHFGRIFRNNAILSSRGIPQIAAIMGSCVAGGAYLPIMSDEAIIVNGTGSVFLAGPFLVKAAIGEDVDAETLGGATTHSEISGVTDYEADDDEEAIEIIRNLMGHMGPEHRFGYTRDEPQAPAFDPEDIYGLFPDQGTSQYDMHEILARIVDEDSWTEYKKGYGRSLLTGYARIDGWNVGIVANQRSVVRNRTSHENRGEIQVGGVIYADAADKATRFIMNCNQKEIPLVFFQDVTGFMVGKRAEHGGIIKDGAKMVNAVSNSTVPKFTVVMGNSYGAGNYAMCGRAYDPRMMLAWPTAKIAVMGGTQASKVLKQIQVRKLEKQGKELSAEDEKELLDRIQDRYEEQTTPYYAAARLWVDAIIDPVKTREWISAGIDTADLNPELPKFNAGVIQT
ncbi:methylcrotonoyl-CoA carboxylase [Longibacter salinarum]|uniref:Methylcrotonoyl-CoA carboxylase n=1 Tax=Longibacter salinarum TaxID=1850348 RepID=A0A2A8CZC6_9BACT|nr:carboxyl transferase domain-containing protein [Longibacter salinarum]PEN14035.1 methylcrotonoyl-CoA carboxylase [Longibacter salinarum]